VISRIGFSILCSLLAFAAAIGYVRLALHGDEDAVKTAREMDKATARSWGYSGAFTISAELDTPTSVFQKFCKWLLNKLDPAHTARARTAEGKP
jgi:hypothetical protein